MSLSALPSSGPRSSAARSTPRGGRFLVWCPRTLSSGLCPSPHPRPRLGIECTVTSPAHHRKTRPRPSTWRCRWADTVSTSGSAGTRATSSSATPRTTSFASSRAAAASWRTPPGSGESPVMACRRRATSGAEFSGGRWFGTRMRRPPSSLRRAGSRSRGAARRLLPNRAGIACDGSWKRAGIVTSNSLASVTSVLRSWVNDQMELSYRIPRGMSSSWCPCARCDCPLTSAPELPGSEDLVRELAHHRIRPAIGHTGADARTTERMLGLINEVSEGDALRLRRQF